MRTCYLALIFVFSAGAAVLDRVAVVVGDDVITESEVQEELRLDEFMSAQPLDLSPAQQRVAADRLVDQQLLRHELQIAHYPAPQPAEADAMLRTFRRQRFPNQADYQSALQKYGITEEQIKQHLLWQLTVLRFTDERFGANSPRSASRTAAGFPPPQTSSAGHPAASQPQDSADRLAANTSPEPGETSVEQQMDAWLKEARSSTHIEFKKEAFQ